MSPSSLTRRCIECEQVFTPAPTAQTKITCSVKCSDDRERRRQRLKNYGLSLVEYDAMWERQGGACAICGAKELPGERRLAIDHDHSCCSGTRSCGECVRGLLCTNCNIGVGSFADDRVLLGRAIAYLDRHRREVGSDPLLVADWGSAVLSADPVGSLPGTDRAGQAMPAGR